MLRNELRDGISVDTGWIRVFWWHFNIIYKRNISCVCIELWLRDIDMWLEKWNRGGENRCEEGVSIKDKSQCGIGSGEF